MNTNYTVCLLVSNDLDKAVLLAVDHRLGIDIERHLDLGGINALRLGLGQREADKTRLGPGEDHAAILALLIGHRLGKNRGCRHPSLVGRRMSQQ